MVTSMMYRGSTMMKQAAVCAGLCALCAAPALAESSSVTRSGDVLSIALPLGTLGLELYRRDYTGAWQFGQSFAATLIATEALKRTTNVERPDETNDESFPSGHASRAFASATYVHRRHGIEAAWPLYAAGAYVGYTRVQADRHRWSDVAGSLAVSALMSWWLVDPASESGVSVALAPDGVQLCWSVPLGFAR
jgi:PAP2 superfamily